MTPNHRVSIVIPTYNEEANLPACLESVQRLKYPDVETVVVDNGSADRTVDIAKSFGAKVLQDSTKRVSGLRNLGAASSSGDIIAFVDADCVVDENWISSATEYFDRPDVVLWGSPPVPPKDATWVQTTWYLLRKKGSEVQQVAWLESMNLWVRRDTLQKVGGFCESLTTCEDVDFSYRLSPYGKIVSDSRIKVTHYGEAATIRTFIRKERWRGQSNWEAIRSYGFRLRDIPSAFIPLHYGLLLPASLMVQPFLPRRTWLALPLVLLILPNIAALFKLRSKNLCLIDAVRLLFLLQFYFLSRTLALFKRRKSHAN